MHRVSNMPSRTLLRLRQKPLKPDQQASEAEILAHACERIASYKLLNRLILRCTAAHSIAFSANAGAYCSRSSRRNQSATSTSPLVPLVLGATVDYSPATMGAICGRSSPAPPPKNDVPAALNVGMTANHRTVLAVVARVVRFRRVSPVAARPAEGPLSKSHSEQSPGAAGTGLHAPKWTLCALGCGRASAARRGARGNSVFNR